jgi:hypothetical protein
MARSLSSVRALMICGDRAHISAGAKDFMPSSGYEPSEAESAHRGPFQVQAAGTAPRNAKYRAVEIHWDASVQSFFTGMAGEPIGASRTCVMHRPMEVEGERIKFGRP